MANAKQDVVKLKLIFVNQKKNDGSSFISMKTIVKGGKWVSVKFGDNVNTKLFKNENQIITAKKEDVRLPLSYEPYVSKKDGKTKYPYIWIENIIGFEKYVGTPKSEPKETTQDEFQMDDETTDAVEEKQ